MFKLFEARQNIGLFPFVHCISLNGIKVDSLNAKYKDIDGVLYNKTGTELLCVRDKRIINGTYNIPSGVKSIGIAAFFECTSLKSIEIPTGVTSIGDSAFRCCGSLEIIEIPLSVMSIGENTFESCSNLTSIEIPLGVTNIGASAFAGCGRIKSIEIPTGVTSIGDCAFNSCSSLETVRVEAVDPPDLYSNSFSSCSKLAKIEVPSASLSKYKTADDWKDYASIIVGF
ncbi:MAG: leucine-rich repeat domain-containing protein [Spirochaetes bacterium]|nr:leucine-rich repeat domain-containing protein [Spirochaetota bacterium]